MASTPPNAAQIRALLAKAGVQQRNGKNAEMTWKEIAAEVRKAGRPDLADLLDQRGR